MTSESLIAIREKALLCTIVFPESTRKAVSPLVPA
jgi:hypothetical protein